MLVSTCRWLALLLLRKRKEEKEKEEEVEDMEEKDQTLDQCLLMSQMMKMSCRKGEVAASEGRRWGR